MDDSAFALEDTLSVYGIRKNPFPIDEVDDYFFSSPTLGKQLKVLRNLVEYGELLLVISGREGAGKTTFLKRFLIVADKRWQCCCIQANDSMSIDSLVHALLEGFGLSASEDDAQADELLLREHLANVHADGNLALLAVDDAHYLPQICTEFLLGLAEQRADFEIRLLLTTEPGRLGFATNDPKRVHVVVLKPFDMQQCADYLHTRLSNAGLVGDSPFTESVVDGIHQDSGGLPGAIHPLALHSLLANSDESKLRRGAPMSKRAVVYLALALLIGGAAALFLRPEPEFNRLVVSDAGPRGKIQGRDSTGTPTNAETDAADTDAQTSPVGESFSGSIVAKDATGVTPVQESTAVEAKGGNEVNAIGPDEDAPATSTARAVTTPSKIESGAGGASAEARVSLASNVTPAAVVAPANAPAPKPAPDYSLDWLRDQKPSHYVIQLVGTSSAAGANKFLEQHELGAKGAWFLTSRNGQPWYVVVYGMYPDSASARAAIAALPESLRAGSPWPRSVANVLESAR